MRLTHRLVRLSQNIHRLLKMSLRCLLAKCTEGGLEAPIFSKPRTARDLNKSLTQ